MSTPPAAVEADLNYLRNTGHRPVNHTYEPPPGVARNSGVVDTRRVVIRNARLASSTADWSLDRSGFQLVQHRSALDSADDYTSEARIRAVCYAEVDAVLRSVTGAQRRFWCSTTRCAMAHPSTDASASAIRCAGCTTIRPSSPHPGAWRATCRRTRRRCGSSADSRS
jgi:hypothetical protein